KSQHTMPPATNPPTGALDFIATGSLSNENKMRDGGEGRASLGMKVWKSSQKLRVQRSAVRSIAWLGDERGNIISVILGTSNRDRRSSRGGTTKPCRDCQMREGAK